jgi:3-deoxy-D-manno-octulosonate 8-phosphate phosphatase (KDO 8-P phosphatase)
MDAVATSVLARAKDIRLLLLDVDGVLTDGGLWYSDAGYEAKRFHVQDGQGLALLRAHGVQLGVVSGRRSTATRNRVTELGFAHIHLGVKGDKWPIVEGIMATLALAPNAVAYMGDDWPDLTVLQRVGLAMAPANAVSEVRQRVHWIARSTGGEGAVREACNLILRAQGGYEPALAPFLAGNPALPT